MSRQFWGKTKKMVIAMAAALAVACGGLGTVTALAASTASASAGIYGTLTGTITSTGILTASITTNPDTAYLILGGTQVAKDGTTLVTQQNVQSSRGATSYTAVWTNINSSAYTLFGVHGVQGGSINGSYAVYTSVGVNR